MSAFLRALPWLIGAGGAAYLFSKKGTLDEYAKTALPYVKTGVILLGTYVVLTDVLGEGK